MFGRREFTQACPRMWEEKVYFIKGFGLVRPDPFSLHELGGVWVFSSTSHTRGVWWGLGKRLGERDIFPQLLINSPFTRYSQAFFSSSMYVYSVYTEPTSVVRWTGCHGNGYIPIQQRSDLSITLLLEIHAEMVMFKHDTKFDQYYFMLSHHQLEKVVRATDQWATTTRRPPALNCKHHPLTELCCWGLALSCDINLMRVWAAV